LTDELEFLETETIKRVHSPAYNYMFNKKSGKFLRWGKRPEDDPPFSPYGPEIADIEVSTVCHGPDGIPCRFCYKSNSPDGENMSLKTFRRVLDSFFFEGQTILTQVALGVGDIDGNPDLWDIMRHCWERRVVPNITINGGRMTDEHVKLLVELAGAVSVSHYTDDLCFDAVKRLTDAGHRQVNIHELVSQGQMEDQSFDVIDQVKSDPRLKDLNAVVFLASKPKGRGTTLCSLEQEIYNALVKYALEQGISFGFDSCSAPMFLEAVKGHPDYARFLEQAEPCESYLFSMYVNVRGEAYPCSFLEGGVGYIPVNLLEQKVKDLWTDWPITEFRDRVLATAEGRTCRRCPHFDLYEK
jgi:radical SAM protein with 4Fe4S-binding SPASM domain